MTQSADFANGRRDRDEVLPEQDPLGTGRRADEDPTLADERRPDSEAADRDAAEGDAARAASSPRPEENPDIISLDEQQRAGGSLDRDDSAGLGGGVRGDDRDRALDEDRDRGADLDRDRSLDQDRDRAADTDRDPLAGGDRDRDRALDQERDRAADRDSLAGVDRDRRTDGTDGETTGFPPAHSNEPR